VQKHHLMLKNPLDDVFAPYGIAVISTLALSSSGKDYFIFSSE
jgi:hypothetical protein